MPKITSHAPNWWKESDDMCIPFNTIPECDGRMDGLICHDNIVLCLHRHADVTIISQYNAMQMLKCK